MAESALSDLRVLELGEFVSAAWCTRAFAVMGAEVIKVESPSGDRSRRSGPFPNDIPNSEKSGLYLYLNTGIKGITLDIVSATGRQVVLELAKHVDVIVDNHLPGQMRDWGLTYSDFQSVNPRVIFTSITPFGWEGPWSDYKSNDLVGFHASGIGHETPLMFVTDPENEPPLKGAEYQGDMTTGWTAASATMMAVFHRVQTGLGQMLDVSHHEALANMVRPNVARYTYSGDVVEDRPAAPAPAAMQCADGYVALSALADAHWAGLKNMLGEPEWIMDERFSTREGRMENRQEISDLTQLEVLELSKDDVFRRAQENHIPCFPYNTVEDVLKSDQYEHREYWVPVAHPIAGEYNYPGVPFKFSKSPGSLGRSAPLLGEHNDAILVDLLGYSAQDLRDWRISGLL